MTHLVEWRSEVEIAGPLLDHENYPRANTFFKHDKFCSALLVDAPRDNRVLDISVQALADCFPIITANSTNGTQEELS